MELVGEAWEWGIVLCHERDVEVGGDIGDEGECIEAILYLAGEDEMTYDDASVSQAIVVGRKGRAFLVVHLMEGSRCD